MWPNSNMKTLLNSCRDLIQKYEKTNIRSVPSCEKDMMEVLESTFRAANKEIQGWKKGEVDYVKVANAWLASVAFDLLASGRYHIYYGQLNPMRCGTNLLAVYTCAMDYGVSTGEISQEGAEEEFKKLRDAINHVG